MTSLGCISSASWRPTGPLFCSVEAAPAGWTMCECEADKEKSWLSFSLLIWISQQVATPGESFNIPKFWCWILVKDWILCDRVDAMAAASLLLWPRFFVFIFILCFFRIGTDLKALYHRLKSLIAFDKNCAKTRRKAQVLLLCGFCLSCLRIYFDFRFFRFAADHSLPALRRNIAMPKIKWTWRRCASSKHHGLGLRFKNNVSLFSTPHKLAVTGSTPLFASGGCILFFESIWSTKFWPARL